MVPGTAGTEVGGQPPGPNEGSLLSDRRKAVFGSDPGNPRWALALSGGGIRSATFSLGVLQAVAEARQDRQPATTQTFKDSLLSRFDYLSTVSGGGYVGSFLCSLFIPQRLRPAPEDKSIPATSQTAADAADDAVRVLSGGIPERIRGTADYSGDRVVKAPLAWLRENGRYLAPTSSGDGLYAAALALRNWAAVHVVVGTLLTALVVFVIAARASISRWWAPYADWEARLFTSAESAGDIFSVSAIWWSTLSVACILPMLTIGIGTGVAYWLVEGPDDRDGKAWTSSATVMLGLGILAAGFAWWELHSGTNETLPEAHRLGFLLYVGIECLLGTVIFGMAICRHNGVAAQRVALTRSAETVLVLTIALAALALVDTLGQTFYLASKNEGSRAAVLSPAALAIALVWIARRVSAKSSIKLPDFVKKLPLSTIAGFAGVAIFALVGALWATFAQWVVWGGEIPEAGKIANGAHANVAVWVLIVTLLLAYLNGFFAGFINLSSLQTFYAARLTRAYLGASNGKRFDKSGPAASRSAAEPIASDSLKQSHYFKDGALTTFAPIHIINVTVNKTVDPAEQLVQRDRKGQPLAVLPFGIGLDSARLSPFPSPLAGPRWFRSSVARELDVGEWIATSGAAVSTGIGRETSLGLSLLLGASNVRLGTWWPTGHAKPDTESAFKTQRYLSYELRAAFHGTHREWQYLSDGGHFENTAIFELLREERKVSRIFACDNGGDPEYQFGDLANLIRLAKIDFGIEIKVVEPATIDSKSLTGLFGTPETFRNLAVGAAPAALLLYAERKAHDPVQIVMIKPRVGAEAPADVLQYARTHAPFPQQTTADQFFDEAQWESYRALGYWQGSRIFNSQVLKALDEHAVARCDQSRSSQ